MGLALLFVGVIFMVIAWFVTMQQHLGGRPVSKGYATLGFWGIAITAVAIYILTNQHGGCVQ